LCYGTKIHRQSCTERGHNYDYIYIYNHNRTGSGLSHFYSTFGHAGERSQEFGWNTSDYWLTSESAVHCVSDLHRAWFSCFATQTSTRIDARLGQGLSLCAEATAEIF
jgi:hypothetical protein